MLTPELDENTEKLTLHARQLINAEFRNLVWDGVTKKIQDSQIPALSPQQLSAAKVSKTIAVKTTRKKIREEWDALKNSTLISNDSPENYPREVLRGVVAYIEISNVPKATALTVILKKLGATVKESFTPLVTHVIFKRGTLETFKRAKLLNVHLVSVLWIEACQNARRKIPEDMFPVPEQSDYTSPRTFRRFVEGLGSEERQKLVMRATRRTPLVPPPVFDRRVTRSSTQSDSSESTIILQISTDDSGNKDKLDKAKQGKEKNACKEQIGDKKIKKEKVTNKRRLFRADTSKTNEKEIVKKKDTKTKRKLFTHNRLDDTSLGVSTMSDSSGAASTPNRRDINIYRINRKSKTAPKKNNQTKEKSSQKDVKRKGSHAGTDSECSDSDKGSPNSSAERRERVQELVKMTQIQSETNKKQMRERKRRLIKEKKKKKLTKEERENIAKANKIARRRENEILKASQPRSCKKLNIYCSKGSKKPSLVSTFLHRTENRWLKECIDRLGGFTFKATVAPDTTHVICGGPVRTINLLKGLARGCWLLDKRWAEESARVGHWLTEHEYELVKFSPAVQKCRVERQVLGDDYRLDIFRQSGGVHVSERCARAADLRALVSLCGGVAATSAACAQVVVGEMVDGRVCVSELWILDSIAASRCRSLNSYLI